MDPSCSFSRWIILAWKMCQDFPQRNLYWNHGSPSSSRHDQLWPGSTGFSVGTLCGIDCKTPPESKQVVDSVQHLFVCFRLLSSLSLCFIHIWWKHNKKEDKSCCKLSWNSVVANVDFFRRMRNGMREKKKRVGAKERKREREQKRGKETRWERGEKETRWKRGEKECPVIDRSIARKERKHERVLLMMIVPEERRVHVWFFPPSFPVRVCNLERQGDSTQTYPPVLSPIQTWLITISFNHPPFSGSIFLLNMFHLQLMTKNSSV